jgi:uncharacterized membrane protein
MEFDLFSWWVISISFSIVFLTLVSIYLYSNRNCEKAQEKKKNATTLARNFIFVFVLISLLFFYIVSVRIGSAPLFAAGNIVVEVILITYLFKNRTTTSEETPNNH